ncbi:phage tail protein [Geobacter sp.]|uniref:phage tail protein n=1 Tax=Geobacter sp. TaxID=46610 RepID=UPI002615E4C9|nr:phage tail protein [Geobacter sp.]
MFAQLGDIRFELITYFDGLEGSQAYNFAEHQVIEGKPRLQYIGDALETVSIALKFHVAYCDPAFEYQRLREAGAIHRALPFVFGNGLYRGRYVIVEITDTVEATAADGTVIAVEAKCSLKEWVDDTPLVIRKQAKKDKAPARRKNGKRHTKAKKEEVPQLSAASRAAGFRVVDKNRIVRMGK